MKRFAVLLLGMLASSSVRAALPPDSADVRLGVTQIGSACGNDTDSKIQVFLTVRKPTQCESSRPEYWGTELNKPATVVTKLLVTVGSDTVSVPYGAYGDLGEPRTISVACRDSNFTITIRGSDGAGSYTAKLVVAGLEVRKRRVESNEFPDAVWEDTSYSFFGHRDEMR